MGGPVASIARIAVPMILSAVTSKKSRGGGGGGGGTTIVNNPAPKEKTETGTADDKEEQRRRVLGRGGDSFGAAQRQKSVLGEPVTTQKKTLLGQ